MNKREAGHRCDWITAIEWICWADKRSSAQNWCMQIADLTGVGGSEARTPFYTFFSRIEPPLDGYFTAESMNP